MSEVSNFDEATISRLTQFLEGMKTEMPDLKLWDGNEDLDVDQMVQAVRDQTKTGKLLLGLLGLFKDDEERMGE